ncbi:MAG: DUF2075 domain-containing protein [Gammaproteobacteria bacterium]
MPAYVRRTVTEFVKTSANSIIAELHRGYSSDGFSTQYTAQSKAWEISVPLIQEYLNLALESAPTIGRWRILLELPLYRLRRRIDIVLIASSTVIVIELKVGADKFQAADRNQVEEYALDLRDFHEYSGDVVLLPVLWCTEASPVTQYLNVLQVGVAAVVNVGANDLADLLVKISEQELNSSVASVIRDDWETGAYRPVPTVIEAATSLFAGHGVEEIARADASNLAQSAGSIIEIIERTKRAHERALIFLAGVPGSGKTLAGLQVVHRAVQSGVESSGDIIYLSGNTPLVTVLREALARDEHLKLKAAGVQNSLKKIRQGVRTRIQHIIDFLQEYLSNDKSRPPHEHAIVFDEAQRAWDKDYGQRKFGRAESEPSLILEIMGRHDDWCAVVCLIGGGQEINAGENGIEEWGTALSALDSAAKKRWVVYGPPHFRTGSKGTAGIGLGILSSEFRSVVEGRLELQVPLRNYRSPLVADWVAAVIDGDQQNARSLADEIHRYPILLTRSLETAKGWLVESGRGKRRYGLVASSGARRLRAEGLGVTLNATEGDAISHWYLNDKGDVRASYAMEVTANEYTTQGLELDFAGMCWGGDFVRNESDWTYRRFMGNRWVRVTGERRRFVANSYRVLLTRAREGMIIWIPQGDQDDATREPEALERTSAFLKTCGAIEI